MGYGHAGADDVVGVAVGVGDVDGEVDGVFGGIKREGGEDGIPSGNAVSKSNGAFKEIVGGAVHEGDVGANAMGELFAATVHGCSDARHLPGIPRIPHSHRHATGHGAETCRPGRCNLVGLHAEAGEVLCLSGKRREQQHHAQKDKLLHTIPRTWG